MELEEAIKKTKALLNLNDILFEETGTYLYLGKQEKELIQILLNHLTKQEKMIGNIFSYLDDHRIDDNICDEILNYGAKDCIHNGNCAECIKQYFEKKANEE